jgi:hypothetical protein
VSRAGNPLLTDFILLGQKLEALDFTYHNDKVIVDTVLELDDNSDVNKGVTAMLKSKKSSVKVESEFPLALNFPRHAQPEV